MPKLLTRIFVPLLALSLIVDPRLALALENPSTSESFNVIKAFQFQALAPRVLVEGRIISPYPRKAAHALLSVIAAVGLIVAAGKPLPAQTPSPAAGAKTTWAQRESRIVQSAGAEVAAEKNLARKAKLDHWQELFSEMDDGRTPPERRAAIRAILAQTMTPADWRQSLESASVYGIARAEVAYQVAKTGDKSAIPALRNAYRYTNYPNIDRQAVEWAIERLGGEVNGYQQADPKRTTAWDVRLLAENPDPKRKNELLNGLRFTAYSDEIIAALLKISSPAKEWTDYWILRWHNSLPLKELLKDDAEILITLRTLGSLHDPASLPVLREALHFESQNKVPNDRSFENEKIHLAAIAGLELYDQKEASDVIKDALRDPSQEVRMQARHLLEHMKWEPENLTDKSYWFLEQGKRDELAALGQAAIPALKSQLSRMWPDEQGFREYYEMALRIDPTLRRVLAREWLNAADTHPALARKGLDDLLTGDTPEEFEADIKPVRFHITSRTGGENTEQDKIFNEAENRSQDPHIHIKLYGPPPTVSQATSDLRSKVQRALPWSLVGFLSFLALSILGIGYSRFKIMGVKSPLPFIRAARTMLRSRIHAYWNDESLGTAIMGDFFAIYFGVVAFTNLGITLEILPLGSIAIALFLFPLAVCLPLGFYANSHPSFSWPVFRETPRRVITLFLLPALYLRHSWRYSQSSFTNPEDYWVEAQSSPDIFFQEALRTGVHERLAVHANSPRFDQLRNELNKEVVTLNERRVLYAAWILCVSGDLSGLTALIQYAQGRPSDIYTPYLPRYWADVALRLLAHSGRPEAIPVLIAAFKGEKNDDRHKVAIEGMLIASATHEQWVKAWRNAVSSGYDDWILRAISELSDLGGSDAIHAILPLLGSSQDDIRQNAIAALRKLSLTDEQWAQGWIVALGSENEHVRSEAVSELIRNPTPLAEQGIRQAVGDTADAISTTAETELRRRYPESDDEWVTTWMAVLQGPQKQSEAQDTAARSRAITRLRLLRDARSIPALCAVLKKVGEPLNSLAFAALDQFLEQGIGFEHSLIIAEACVTNISLRGNYKDVAGWQLIKRLMTNGERPPLVTHAEFLRLLEAHPWGFNAACYLPTVIGSNPFERTSIGRLINLVNDDLSLRMANERDNLRTQIDQGISAYLRRHASAEMTVDYASIANLYATVHFNLTHCLTSITNLGMSISDTDELRRAQPFNDALTSTLRLLGSNKDAAGFLDVVQITKQALPGSPLWEMVISVTQSKKREAPAELSGILEILRHEGKALASWGPAEWSGFSQNIQDYYDRGFKVVSPDLFRYFQANKDNAVAIETLRRDIDQYYTRRAAFGHFFGLPKEVKSRYHLNNQDEVMMAARYVQITDAPAAEFETLYSDVGDAIDEKNPVAWQAEVPQVLRTLLSTSGSRLQYVYRPDNSNETAHLESVVSRLVSLISGESSSVSLAQGLELMNTNPDAWLAFWTRELPLVPDADRHHLGAWPDDAVVQREWLSRWNTALHDTLLNDQRVALQTRIRAMVNADNLDVDRLEKLLLGLGFNSDRLARSKRASGSKDIVSLRASQLVQVITERTLALFNGLVQDIEAQRRNYREIPMATQERIFAGFFDDKLHLAGEFLQSYVCTRIHRASQIRDGLGQGYHFGTIALKNGDGVAYGFSQVQLLKIPLAGRRGGSLDGYYVLCLTGINLSRKALPMTKENAILTILQAAHDLARMAGLQGAVVTSQPEIRSTDTQTNSFLDSLVANGTLTPAKLSREVRLGTKGLYQYPYTDVLVIGDRPMISLTPTTLEDVLQTQQQKEALLIKHHLEFMPDAAGHPLGDVRFNGELSENGARRLSKQADDILRSMPPQILEEFRTHLRENGVGLSIISEPGLDRSAVLTLPDEITIQIGRDVRYNGEHFDSLGLRELLAEGVASAILVGYGSLKQDAATNENARLRIDVVTGLLNYPARIALYHKWIRGPNWTPGEWDRMSAAEQSHLTDTYLKQLEEATAKLKRIAQNNLFENVFNDVDSGRTVFNYLHILSRHLGIDEPEIRGAEIYRLIERVSQVTIRDKVSLSHVRNMAKEFIFDGTVTLSKIGGPERVAQFQTLDDHERIEAWRQTLYTTSDANTFYATLRDVLLYALPLYPDEADLEIRRLFTGHQQVMDTESRALHIRDVFFDIFERRLGPRVLETVKQQLSANRSANEFVPYFAVRHRALPESEYDLESDWVEDLFPLPHDLEASDEGDDALSHLTWRELSLGFAAAVSSRDSGLGFLAAVIIHEVLGHGLAAWMKGYWALPTLDGHGIVWRYRTSMGWKRLTDADVQFAGPMASLFGGVFTLSWLISVGSLAHSAFALATFAASLIFTVADRGALFHRFRAISA